MRRSSLLIIFMSTNLIQVYTSFVIGANVSFYLKLIKLYCVIKVVLIVASITDGSIMENRLLVFCFIQFSKHIGLDRREEGY